MKKFAFRAVALAAALMVLCLPLCAQAKTRYPALRGTVTDDAGVLSESVRQDLVTLQERMDDADVDVKLYVALVHFLDGEEAQAYADAVFAQSGLDEDAVLVLGAAGEDRYAVSAGKDALKLLQAARLNDLFVSSGFATQFKGQQYNAAIGQYAVALARYAGERADETVNVAGLFGEATEQPQPAEDETGALYNGVTSFDEFLSTLIATESTRPQPTARPETHREEESGGLSPLGWIVLVLLVMLLLGQSDSARRARRRVGCGCSPLGYLFSALGISALLRRRK